MNNNILDELEKFKGPRTCPECGYQFPLEKFVKRYIMAYGLSKRACQGCGELIKCDFITIQILSLAGLVISGILFAVATAYVDLGFFNFIFLLPGFALFLLAFYYVKFEKVE